MIINYKDIGEYTTRIRRSIHSNPELGFHEFRTSLFIENELEKLNLDKVEIVADTGVLGVLSGTMAGNSDRCILLRADIDALPILEKTHLDYASKNEGVMHACGHDAHTAYVLGAAKILSSLRDRFQGTVKFLFQPCEEGGGIRAVDKVLKYGIMENPKVTASLAGHIWPSLPAGEIGLARKCAMACSTNFSINVKGKGGHGATPEKTIDPISIANQIYTSVQLMIARSESHIEPIVVSICSINAGGDRYNIIPDECTMKGIIRSGDADINERISEKIKLLAGAIAASNGGEVDYKNELSYYPVINDEKMMKRFSISAKSILSSDKINIIEEMAMTGENYSCFSRMVPSVYAYIGTYNEEKGAVHPLHSPMFKIDEDVLPLASALFSQTIIDYLNNGLE